MASASIWASAPSVETVRDGAPERDHVVLVVGIDHGDADPAVPLEVARLLTVPRRVEHDVVTVEVDPQRRDLGRPSGFKVASEASTGRADERTGLLGQDVGHGSGAPFSFSVPARRLRGGSRVSVKVARVPDLATRPIRADRHRPGAQSPSTPSACRSTSADSRWARLETAADVTSAEPWKVPGNWCSSTETPAWSRRWA